MKIVRISKAFLKNSDNIKETLTKLKRRYRRYAELMPLLNISEEPIDSETLERLRHLLNESLGTLILSANARIARGYAKEIVKINVEIERMLKKAEYDFFRECGKCGKCCLAPHIFSFEKKFIEKHFNKLEEAEGFYHGKQINGKCIFYSTKGKCCSIYESRPMDCKLFPFSFIVKKIEAENIDVSPKEYVFLLKAKGCIISTKLSMQDMFDALYLVSSILSKIDLEEGYYYSSQVDPARMELTFSIPCKEMNDYRDGLKNMVGGYSKQ